MASNNSFDICGWATKFGVKCEDGRTISDHAFDDCDGKTVPVVWEHMHDSPSNVLGHALLRKMKDGMYAYVKFNDSKEAKDAKLRVDNHDLTHFSIFANKLKHSGSNVVHGIIREVSLVLGGANPEAVIEFPVLEHSSGETSYDEMIYYNYSDPIMKPMPAPAPRPMPVQQPAPMNMLPRIPTYQPVLAHSASPAPTQEGNKMATGTGRTVGDVFNSLSEEQKNVVYFILGQMMEEMGSGGSEMKHSAFDNTPNYVTADDMSNIMRSVKERRTSSLKSAFEDYYGDELAHSVYNADGSEQTYGVANIDMLFPEYRNLNNPPDFIKRDTDWVNVVMNGVHHTPFSRIKSQFANITMDEARAKGYIKGQRKAEEVFTLLRRTTDPQTIYKKQKLDRDDILDITDFDVVNWIKGEMRLMLDEEIARAILIGDGRLATDPDKIQSQHVRDILSDDDLYTIKVSVAPGDNEATTAKNFIRSAIKGRKEYKGSGNLILFTSEDMLTEMLLLEDDIGRPLYSDASAVARKLRMDKIVTFPLMEGMQDADGHDVLGIAVDLKDYNVGADKGASVEMFEDFDIDFNQEKYLIETRISGALTKPYSAIALIKNGTTYTYTEVTPASGANPKALGYYEKEGKITFKTKDTTVVEGKTYYEKTAE